MGLRCSLLGHDYGEPEVGREREERGSEVVLTVRTYEECSRCGDRHLISENTEITTLSPDERRRSVDTVEEGTSPRSQARPEPQSQARPDRPTGRTPGAPGPTEKEGRREQTRKNPPRAAGAVRPTTPIGDGEPGANTDGGTPTPASPTASRTDRSPPEGAVGEATPDDSDGVGVALDGDDPEEPDERKPGEWPTSDDPEVGDERDRWGGVGIDRIGDDEPEPPETRAPEPSEPAEQAADGAGLSEDAGPGTGIASAESVPAPGRNPPVESADTEFYCPTCSFVAAGDEGSLRPGDICPGCGRGYLGERER